MPLVSYIFPGKASSCCCSRRRSPKCYKIFGFRSRKKALPLQEGDMIIGGDITRDWGPDPEGKRR